MGRSCDCPKCGADISESIGRNPSFWKHIRNGEAMTDLVIVSMHERGFPQADLYLGAGDMTPDEFERLGLSPDSFFTMRKGQTLIEAIAMSEKHWPGARIVEADEDLPEDEDD